MRIFPPFLKLNSGPMKMDCRSALIVYGFFLESSHHLFFFLNLLNVLQENYYWLDRILRSYQSRTYLGDVSAAFEVGEIFVFFRVQQYLNCCNRFFFFDIGSSLAYFTKLPDLFVGKDKIQSSLYTHSLHYRFMTSSFPQPVISTTSIQLFLPLINNVIINFPPNFYLSYPINNLFSNF